MSDVLPANQPSPAVSAHGDACPLDGPMERSGQVAARARFERKWAFFRRYWWLPAVTLILSVGAAVAYVLLAPPTFISSARMWETEKLRLTEGAAFTEDLQNYYGTQMELLQSDRMLQLALESLQAFGANTVPRDKEGKPMKVQVEVTQQPKSAVLILQSSSANPVYAQAFLNSLMSVFQNYKRNIRQTVTGSTFSSIADQVQRLELDLRTDQQALAAFQRTNNLAILQEEGTVSGGYLARLRTELSDLQLESQLLEAAALEQESNTSGGANATPYLLNSLRTTAAAAALGTTERQTVFKELELLKAQRQKLVRSLKPKHPKIARLDADIQRGQQLAELYLNQTRDQLGSARQAIKMRMEGVLASIKDWETRLVEFKARITDVERLKATVARSQLLYDRLMVLLENVDISRNINQETLTVLQAASPAERSYLQEILVLGVATFLGLALGGGLVLWVENRDDRFTSRKEVTDAFGDSIIGQIPDVKVLDQKTPRLLLDEADELQPLAESYRNLRSAVLFLPAGTERPKIMLVTSALANEGKSTVTAHLARSIAAGGSRVLLVDGDLRNGALHAMLGLKAEPGLAELLSDPGCADALAQIQGLPTLSFIARGCTTHGHPGDTFLGHALDELLARWRREFDYVLIDSCPVLAGDDVTTLAPKADATLFVVRRQYCGARAVREALEMLWQRQVKVLGLVFNRAAPSARSGYGDKGAAYRRAGGV